MVPMLFPSEKLTSLWINVYEPLCFFKEETTYKYYQKIMNCCWEREAVVLICMKYLIFVKFFIWMSVKMNKKLSKYANSKSVAIFLKFEGESLYF